MTNDDCSQKSTKIIICHLKNYQLSFHSHHLSKHIHFVHVLHHVTHLLELFHKCIHFTDVLSASFCNSFSPAAVDQVGIGSLLRCHRIDHCFNPFKRIIADINILDLLSNTRDHSHQVFQVAHFFDLLELLFEISKIKFV